MVKAPKTLGEKFIAHYEVNNADEVREKQTQLKELLAEKENALMELSKRSESFILYEDDDDIELDIRVIETQIRTLKVDLDGANDALAIFESEE